MQTVSNVIQNYHDKNFMSNTSKISSSAPGSHRNECEKLSDEIILTAKDIVLKPFIISTQDKELSSDLSEESKRCKLKEI